jgi:predicted ATPase
LGICLFYLGDIATAHTHLEEGLAIYDAQRPHTHTFPAGQDLGVLALTYDAMALWALGYPEQALERSRRAMDLAEEVAHPWSLATAIGYAAVVCVLRGDRQPALERAEATIELATEQGIFSWIGRGMMLRGWALAELGQAREGLAQIQQGLSLWQANGQELGKPFWLALLGEQYAKVGQVEEGLPVIAEALAIAQTRELSIWEAELQRLQGEFLLQQAAGGEERSSPAASRRSARTTVWATDPSHPCTEAETCFRRALGIARRQQAKSLELRAAMGLSRLWQQQGKGQAARQRLEESYHWFTEGFDTADLKEARELLAQLSN